jgi:hypothetical protein
VSGKNGIGDVMSVGLVLFLSSVHRRGKKVFFFVISWLGVGKGMLVLSLISTVCC